MFLFSCCTCWVRGAPVLGFVMVWDEERLDLGGLDSLLVARRVGDVRKEQV